MDLLFGLQQHFALFGLSALDGLVDDAGRFLLRAADLFFSNVLAVADAKEEEDDGSYQKACGQANKKPYHNSAHLLSGNLGMPRKRNARKTPPLQTGSGKLIQHLF